MKEKKTVIASLLVIKSSWIFLYFLVFTRKWSSKYGKMIKTREKETVIVIVGMLVGDNHHHNQHLERLDEWPRKKQNNELNERMIKI